MLLSWFDKRIALVGLVLALLAITTLALIPMPEMPMGSGWDKFDHWSAFFILSLLAAHAFPQRPFWRIALALLTYGIAIEIAQYFTRYRSADVMDVVADSIGILIYGFCVWLSGALIKTRMSAE